MIIDLKEAVDFLKENDNFLIITHGHPDGDTIGSALALKYSLEAIGKKAAASCGDIVPSKFDYMGKLTDDNGEFDTIIAVDIADTKLMGKLYEPKYGDKVDLCIDHHGSNRLFAKRTLLDAKAAAACEIVLAVSRELGVETTKEIATCIYTGLTTDTGCFRYTNVTPRTMYMAGDMIDCGADNGMINTLMFETKTKTYIQLEKLAVNGMKLYFDDKCAMICVTQEMFRQSGSDESEIDAIASIPRQIEGVKVGVTLREKPDGTFKVSMRSHNTVNVSEICGELGGGGHPAAAGCQVDGPLENAEKAVLDCIKKYI